MVDDVLLRVAADFTGVERGLRKLRQEINQTVSATPKQKQAASAIGRIEGAAAGVTARTRATGNVQSGVKAQAQLAALAAAAGKQGGLPGFDTPGKGALTKTGQLSASYLKQQLAPAFASMGNVSTALGKQIQQDAIRLGKSTFKENQNKSIKQIGEASTPIANKAGVFGTAAAPMAAARSAAAVDSQQVQLAAAMAHQTKASKRNSAQQQRLGATLALLNKESTEAAAAANIYEKSLLRAAATTGAAAAARPGRQGAAAGAIPPVGGGGGGKGGGGASVAGYPVNFGRGLASTLQYGLPAAALYGTIGALKEGLSAAQELEIEFGIIDDQLVGMGIVGTAAFDEITQGALDSAAATGQSVTALTALQRQITGALSALNSTDNQNINVRNEDGGIDSEKLSSATTEFSLAGAKLAEVVDLPLTEITDGLTAAAIAFDVDFDQIGDTVVTLANRTGVLGKELVSFIGDIAPTAKAAGFELEEIATLAAQVQLASGRSGTAIAEQFSRILPAVSQAKDEMTNLAKTNSSLNTPEFLTAIAKGDVQSQLEQVANSFAEMSKTAQDDVITLLGGRREAGSLIPALANADQQVELMDALGDSAGALDARFEKVKNTLGNTFGRVAEQLKIAFFELFENGLGDSLKQIAKTFEIILKVVSALGQVLGKINDLTGGLLGTALAYGAAMKVAAKAYGAISAMNLLGGGGKVGLLGGLINKGGYGAAAAGAGSGLNAGRAGLAQYGLATVGRKVPAVGAGGTAASGGKLRAAGAGLVATLGAGGIAAGVGLGAAVIAFNKTQSSLEEWNNDLKELTAAARDGEQTVHAIVQDADALEGTNANEPDYWAKIGAFVTGEDAVTQSEALRSAAFAKSQERVLAILGADGVTEAELEATLPEIQEPEFEKAGTITEAKNFQEIKEDVLESYPDLKGDELLKKVESAINKQREVSGGERVKDIDAIAATADELNEKLGIDITTLEREVIEALQSKGRVKEALSDIILDEDATGNKTAQEQASAITDTLVGDTITGNQIETDLDIAALEDNLALVQKQFDAGLVGYTTYFKKRKEDVEALREVIQTARDAGSVTPEQEVQLAEAELAYKEDVSASIVTRVESLLAAAERNGQNDSAGLNAQIEQVKNAILNNQSTLTTTDEAGLLDTYYGLLTKRRDELASLGATEAERETLAAEIIRVEQEIKNVAAQNLIELQLGQTMEALGTTLFNVMGATAYASADAAATGMVQIVNGLAAGGNAAIQAAQDLASLQAALMKRIRAIQIQMGQAALAVARANQGADEEGVIDIDDYNAGRQSDLDEATDLLADTGTISAISKSDLGAFGGVGPGDIGAGGGGGGGGNQETQADIDRARLEIAKAENAGNDAVLANIELMEAAIDAREAEGTPEQADNLQAIARRIKAERAIADQRKEQAKQFRTAVKLFQSATGDTVGAAEQELYIALAEYKDMANRYGADSVQGLQARAELAQAMVAVRDATDARKQTFVSVLLGMNNLERNAIETSNAQLKLAQQQLSQALGVDDKLQKQLAVQQANNAVEDAMAAVRESQFDLRAAELNSADRTIEGAALAVERAREQLARAKEQGQGPAEINRARANLINAEKQQRDTRLAEARENYDFLYDMEEITQRQYLAYLEALLTGLQPGTDAFRELSRAIKGIKDDISGDLQTNLPDSLALPTLYEARRLNQTTGTGVSGSSVGYQDNRNQDITIYVNNGMGEQEVVHILGQALGTGSNGLETTVY